MKRYAFTAIGGGLVAAVAVIGIYKGPRDV